ncbi:MAG: hypothetical protein RMJ31_04000 [Nitrososphaerota archaeon]|nr:hypothetical protein [Nitrososphaerales archaeon]MDW8044919.1 hypothetical protein [Nitrososphaerota archaeon]
MYKDLKEFLKYLALERYKIKIDEAMLEQIASSYERLINELNELRNIEVSNIEPPTYFRVRVMEGIER